MKNLIWACAGLLLLFSCEKDQKFDQELDQIVQSTTEQEQNQSNLEESTSPAEPCEFSVESIKANSTVVVDCILDLKGQEYTLPENVTFAYKEGGEIINGTLVFTKTSQNKIDGRLLNYTLGMKGSVRLADPVFEFVTSKWEIVEGKVSKDQATANKEIFQNMINCARDLGATTFKVDKLDAYFTVGLPHGNQKGLSEDAIHIPSNFTFEMTDNTFLRVQPTHFPWYVLLSTYEVENVIIKGGNLIGDRYTHDYSDFIDEHGISRGRHEWPGLLVTAGSKNIVFDGVYMKDSTGDAFIAGSAGFRTQEGTKWNDGITLKNCTLEGSRRNNMSITDGENLVIENNTIISAGGGSQIKNADGSVRYSSAGVNPQYGIDVEPYSEYQNFRYESRIRYEWVEKVIIRGNTFRNNFAGSIVVSSGDFVTIDGNTSDHAIALNRTRGSSIINNTVVASTFRSGRAGITTADQRHYTDFVGGTLKQFAVDNNVKNNTVEKFSVGMLINGSEAEISGNTIRQCDTGVNFSKVEDLNVHSNTISSTLANSTGIVLGFYGNRVKIYDETINVKARYLFCRDYNKDVKFSKTVASFSVEISNSILKGGKSSRVFNANGVQLLRNSNITTGTEFIKCSQAVFSENTVNAQRVDGLILDACTKTRVQSNSFSLSPNYKGVVEKNTPPGANNTIVL